MNPLKLDRKKQDSIEVCFSVSSYPRSASEVSPISPAPLIGASTERVLQDEANRTDMRLRISEEKPQVGPNDDIDALLKEIETVRSSYE